MAKHWSIRQFQQMCDQLPQQMVKNMSGALDEIANNTTVSIAMKTPRGDDGRNELRESVRYHDGKHPLSKVIRAGGPLTTVSAGSISGDEIAKQFLRGLASGLDYDYSLGIEFGTQFMAAQPFFFPTIRARRESDIRKMRAKIVEDLTYWGFK